MSALIKDRVVVQHQSGNHSLDPRYNLPSLSASNRPIRIASDGSAHPSQIDDFASGLRESNTPSLDRSLSGQRHDLVGGWENFPSLVEALSTSSVLGHAVVFSQGGPAGRALPLRATHSAFARGRNRPASWQIRFLIGGRQCSQKKMHFSSLFREWSELKEPKVTTFFGDVPKSFE